MLSVFIVVAILYTRSGDGVAIIKCDDFVDSNAYFDQVAPVNDYCYTCAENFWIVTACEVWANDKYKRDHLKFVQLNDKTKPKKADIAKKFELPNPECPIYDKTLHHSAQPKLKICKVEYNCPATPVWQGLGKRPAKITKLLKENGHLTIKTIFVGRKEVDKPIQFALNLLSKDHPLEIGEFDKFKDKELKLWDGRLFHSFLCFQLSDGTWYMMEKNERLTVKSNYLPKGYDFKDAMRQFDKFKQKKDEDKFEVLLVHSKDNLNRKLADVFRDVEMKTDCVYYYSAWQYNCQNFVHNFLLHSVEEEAVWASYDTFFWQPIMEQYFGSGKISAKITKVIAKSLTDIAAAVGDLFDKLWTGDSKARAAMGDNEYYYDDDDADADDAEDEVDGYAYSNWQEYMFLRGYLAGKRDGDKANKRVHARAGL